MTLRALQVPAAILIGGVWALAFLMGMYTRDFVAFGLSTGVVVIAAGGVFAAKNGNGNGGGKR